MRKFMLKGMYTAAIASMALALVFGTGKKSTDSEVKEVTFINEYSAMNSNCTNNSVYSDEALKEIQIRIMDKFRKYSLNETCVMNLLKANTQYIPDVVKFLDEDRQLPSGLPTHIVIPTAKPAAPVITTEAPAATIAPAAEAPKTETPEAINEEATVDNTQETIAPDEAAPVTSEAPAVEETKQADEAQPTEKPVETLAPVKPEVSEVPEATKEPVAETIAPVSTPEPVEIADEPAPLEETPVVEKTYSNGEFVISETQKTIVDEEIKLVNELRESKGLNRLTISDKLSSTAQYRAQHLGDNDYFSHYYNGEKHYKVVAETMYGYTGYGIGENIAWIRGYSSDQVAETAMTGFKNSESHYENMLNEIWRTVGVGAYYKNGKWYVVQIFGTEK
ncbi:MAG: hypothetical protein K6G26_01895 [Lachnospiraceae bacterium]|nr:hypothetical protein [Lachnospiraceae bacterium]